MSIKIDEPVRLRGVPSPVMLAVSINGEDVLCGWFDKDDRFQAFTFALHILEPASAALIVKSRK